MWYLLYISTVISSWSTLGMMAEGPFESEEACFAEAENTWNESSGWMLDPRKGSSDYKMNFYSSKYKIYYVDNIKAKIGTYYTCVEPRKVEER